MQVPGGAGASNRALDRCAVAVEHFASTPVAHQLSVFNVRELKSNAVEGIETGNQNLIEAFWRGSRTPSVLERERLDTPSQRRFEAIYHIVRERITLLEYPPTRILDIDTLAAEFDVSRTPIRSVLQRLADHGLVISRHGVPTNVAAIDFERLREAMALRAHLAELIGVLSPSAPDKAAIDAMAEAMAVSRDLIEAPNLRTFAGIDIEVHESVCRLIGNRQLLKVYDELYYRTARAWFYFLPKLGWCQEVLIFHQDISARLSAMQQGDTKAVGFLTRNAVSAVLIRLNSLISKVEKTLDPGQPDLVT